MRTARCYAMSVLSRVLALVLALAACGRERTEEPRVHPQPPPPPAAKVSPPKAPPPRPAQLQRVTLKALGMYCEESCPMKVRYALADDPHVYELGFDVSTESIFVSYDAALGAPEQVTKPMLAAIKTRAGFDPWLSKPSWPADAQEKVQVVWR